MSSEVREVFQLVLQFKPWGAGGIHDLDNLVALEDALEKALKGAAVVDGHDMGADEANVFIHCADPAETFARCLPLVDQKGFLTQLSAAYRPLDREEYARVWPMGSKAEFIVT